MINSTEKMTKREIAKGRKDGEISLGGHRKLKIYGTLNCTSAKRYIAKGQYINQRVFFKSEDEAINNNYRPCARCMPEEYKEWKASQAI